MRERTRLLLVAASCLAASLAPLVLRPGSVEALPLVAFSPVVGKPRVATAPALGTSLTPATGGASAAAVPARPPLPGAWSTPSADHRGAWPAPVMAAPARPAGGTAAATSVVDELASAGGTSALPAVAVASASPPAFGAPTTATRLPPIPAVPAGAAVPEGALSEQPSAQGVAGALPAPQATSRGLPLPGAVPPPIPVRPAVPDADERGRAAEPLAGKPADTGADIRRGNAGATARPAPATASAPPAAVAPPPAEAETVRPAPRPQDAARERSVSRPPEHKRAEHVRTRPARKAEAQAMHEPMQHDATLRSSRVRAATNRPAAAMPPARPQPIAARPGLQYVVPFSEGSAAVSRLGAAIVEQAAAAAPGAVVIHSGARPIDRNRAEAVRDEFQMLGVRATIAAADERLASGEVRVDIR